MYRGQGWLVGLLRASLCAPGKSRLSCHLTLRICILGFPPTQPNPNIICATFHLRVSGVGERLHRGTSLVAPLACCFVA